MVVEADVVGFKCDTGEFNLKRETFGKRGLVRNVKYGIGSWFGILDPAAEKIFRVYVVLRLGEARQHKGKKYQELADVWC